MVGGNLQRERFLKTRFDVIAGGQQTFLFLEDDGSEIEVDQGHEMEPHPFGITYELFCLMR